MAQIISFAPNKSEVERMEEVVYTLQAKNNSPSHRLYG